MIKPIYGAASIGVVKVHNLEELSKTFARVTKEMGNARITAGAISAGADDGDQADDEGGNVRITHLRALSVPRSAIRKMAGIDLTP